MALMAREEGYENGVWVIQMIGTVGHDMLFQFQRQVLRNYRLTEQPPPTMNLMITSGGGDIIAGFAIVAVMRQAQADGHRFVGHVYGEADSMAAYLLQVCDWRTIDSDGMIGLHGWEAETRGDKREQAVQKEWVGSRERQIRLMLHRTTFTEEQINYILEDSVLKYYNAQEALGVGLVDEIQNIP